MKSKVESFELCYEDLDHIFMLSTHTIVYDNNSTDNWHGENKEKVENE